MEDEDLMLGLLIEAGPAIKGNEVGVRSILTHSESGATMMIWFPVYPVEASMAIVQMGLSIEDIMTVIHDSVENAFADVDFTQILNDHDNEAE